MKSHRLTYTALTLALSRATLGGLAQSPALEETALNACAFPLHAHGVGCSAAFVTASPRPLGAVRTYRPFSGLGMATRVGVAGTGFDLATPLSTRFNLRAGTDFFSYGTSFQQEGANV